MAFKNPISQITKLSQLIADSITGAAITGGTITGALIRTATTGQRVEITTADLIHLYSGRAGETAPATIQARDSGSFPTLVVESGNDGAGTSALNLDPGKASLNGGQDVYLVPNAVSGIVRAISALQIGGYTGAGLNRHQVSTPIQAIDFGAESITIPAGSFQTTDNMVAHKLGQTPAAVVACVEAGRYNYYANASPDTGTFLNLSVTQRDGVSSGTAQTMTVFWLAIA
jgi:hypothetical protein